MRPAFSKNPYYFLAYFFVCLLLLFLDSRSFLKPVHSLVQFVSIPVQKSLFGAREGLLGPVRGIREIGKGREAREEVEKRNAFLEARIAESGSLRAENEHMRALLGAGLPGRWVFEPVTVVSVYADSAQVWQSLADIQNRAVVIPNGEKGGIFVGRVEEVTGHLAQVYLPTHINEKTTVVVKDKDSGEKRASGIVEGRGGRMVLGQVLTGETLSPGDLVLTSGDGETPPDLLIGEIEKILDVREETFQQAELKTPVEYEKVTTASVVMKF